MSGTSAVVAGARFRSVPQHHPSVRPMLDELAVEYATRYADEFKIAELRAELGRYPAHEFAPPRGELVLLIEGGGAVAGGAFRRRSEPEVGDIALSTRPGGRDDRGVPAVPTAELKRIWTHSAHRRRGLARRVLAELERRALAAGYPRIYLTTGPRQPEAAALYVATGYTPLFDATADLEQLGHLPFEKWLVPHVLPTES
ncbi:N-acetyltransferase [Cellulomonas chitinilytica]|uniref:N-acetyltransferase n=1 Tax=Cellulomonas chitinilytica TaxID=398759 RepID=A0A919P3L8_9CELL|nr:GNAT family N-acetyltransferase [Cellulomonas chitinilytica]GIG21283.1 N-acetyltransferase [Cellulomonas chitinilytica]